MIYSLISQSSPELGVLLILVVFLCSPFLIVRSLDFRFQNTEYRGLRFGFTGKTGEAFKVFIGGYLLVVLSVGVLFSLVGEDAEEILCRKHSLWYFSI